jgi:Rhodopirellula transposase DDE domain
MMEWPWNGAQLIEVETMLEWAKRMTGKGVHPMVELSRQVYAKGVALSQAAMRAVEARLERHPMLPKWDSFIHPAGADGAGIFILRNRLRAMKIS